MFLKLIAILFFPFSILFASVNYSDSCQSGYREGKSGWNLFGSGSELRSLKALKDAEFIFYYENGEWKVSIFNGGYDRENFKEILKVAKNSGFWLYSQKRIPVVFDGGSTDTLEIKSGWQLLGTDREIVDINGTFNENVAKTVWQYKDKDWKLHTHIESENNHGFAKIEKIEPNDGFWVLAERNSTVTLPTLDRTFCKTTVREFYIDNDEVNISLVDLNLSSYQVVKSFNLPETLIFDNRTIRGNIGSNKKFSIIFRDENGSNIILRGLNRVGKISRVDAFKFLRQSSFISEEGNVSFIQDRGYEAWIDYQMSLPSDSDSESDERYGYLQSVMEFLSRYYPEKYTIEVIADPVNNLEELLDKDRIQVLNNAVVWKKFLHNDDQLRQRVAYALSQLLVISQRSTVGLGLYFRGEATAQYFDLLVKHSFGNFRDLLSDVSKSSAMGYFLTFIGSKKYDPETGVTPDENYARELMQLFTIGLYELNLDGTPKLDESGNPIPSYSQNDVSELSRVFTGWDLPSKLVKGDKGYWNAKQYGSTSYYVHSWLKPMDFHSEYHDFGEKTILGQTIDSNLSGEEDIERALDIIFSNPNLAPHVSRSLITRLVTSNPSSQYVERVATVFNDNGKGVKGDLGATVKAILLDPEARGVEKNPNFGKVDEFVTATTHLFHALGVKPLPYIYYYSTEDSSSPREKIYNEYWFDPSGQFYDQKILNSGSVFNFYSPEYVPSDSYFVENGLFAPELELRDTNNHINFSNMIYTLTNYENYRMFKLGKYNSKGFQTIEERVDGDQISRQNNRAIQFDLSHVYEAIEIALDGDSNSNFENLNSNERGKKTTTGAFGRRVLKTHLIDYLDYKMFGGGLSKEFKKKLLDHLMLKTLSNESSKIDMLVRETIRFLATSPEYMILEQ
jgi:uncharacterized protein (DUF1800 family)